MDNKINGKDILEIIELEEEYRKTFAPNIQDKIVDGIHVNDEFIFPNWWHSIDNLEKKKSMLRKTIEQKQPIQMLEEAKEIEFNLSINRFNNAVHRSNRK